MRTQDTVTAELIETLRMLIAEALSGDAAAQTWLLSSFPGHQSFLRRLWPATPKGKIMSLEGDGQAIFRPSEEQLAKMRAENEAARKVHDTERRAAEDAKNALRDAEAEAALKQEARQLYASLSDSDFERLWPLRLRDDMLIERAKRLAAQPRDSDRMYAKY